jgi:acyl-CoA thioesterase FadM
MSIKEIIAQLKPLDFFLYHQSFVSGEKQKSFNVTYYINTETKHFYTKATFTEDAQGPPNHVHGGATAAIFDESLGGTAWYNGFPVFTAQLNLTFKLPIKITTEIFVDSWIEKIEKKKIYLKGIMMDSDENVYAEASGIYLIQDIEIFKQMGNLPDDYFENIKKSLNINFQFVTKN